jgi:hypothetical protein
MPFPLPLPKQDFPVPILTLPKAGDGKIETLYLAMGECMAAWAQLEYLLASLFHLFIGENESGRAAVRAYGAAEAFYLQRQMLKAVEEVFFATRKDMEIIFDDTTKSCFRAEFKTFLNRAVKLSEFRNKIAHGRVADYYLSGDESIAGYVLIPHYHDNKTDLNFNSGYAYSSHELKRLSDALSWSRLSEQNLCVDKWSLCRVSITVVFLL